LDFVERSQARPGFACHANSAMFSAIMMRVHDRSVRVTFHFVVVVRIANQTLFDLASNLNDLCMEKVFKDRLFLSAFFWFDYYVSVFPFNLFRSTTHAKRRSAARRFLCVMLLLLVIRTNFQSGGLLKKASGSDFVPSHVRKLKGIFL